jgi:spore coat protein U domain-containing protein, fimbrial subunit CupE1/2/3/6
VRALLLAALCILVPAAARAASCTISGTGVAFGTYIPSSPGPTDNTGTVTVTCTALFQTVQYSIALNAGVNSGGSFANRRMSNGAAFLLYQLYSDSTHTTIWGDGTGGTVTVSDSYGCFFCNTSRNYTVFGRIPALQWVNPGLYSDTIVATVTFN